MTMICTCPWNGSHPTKTPVVKFREEHIVISGPSPKATVQKILPQPTQQSITSPFKTGQTFPHYNQCIDTLIQSIPPIKHVRTLSKPPSTHSGDIPPPVTTIPHILTRSRVISKDDSFVIKRARINRLHSSSSV
jgi:hypothetical protein